MKRGLNDRDRMRCQWGAVLCLLTDNMRMNGPNSNCRKGLGSLRLEQRRKSTGFERWSESWLCCLEAHIGARNQGTTMDVLSGLYTRSDCWFDEPRGRIITSCGMEA